MPEFFYLRLLKVFNRKSLLNSGFIRFQAEEVLAILFKQPYNINKLFVYIGGVL